LQNTALPFKPSPSGKTIARFLSKVTPAANGKCLLWTGARLKNAVTGEKTYGVFDDETGTTKLVHRWAWEMYHNAVIPSDKVLLHSCDTPHCISKHCLSLGSKKENSEDMVRKGRSCRGRKKPVKRFTPEEKKQIQDLHASGVSQYEIARRFKRYESTISTILHPRAKKPRKPDSSSGAASAPTEKIKSLWARLDDQLHAEVSGLRRAA
jgi:transposase-like protein